MTTTPPTIPPVLIFEEELASLPRTSTPDPAITKILRRSRKAAITITPDTTPRRRR